MYPPIDPNVYNTYMYYSCGYHPTYQQYMNFLYMYNSYYNRQYIPTFIPINNKPSFCIKGMKCINIKCKDFHHPSKDLDILNKNKRA